jgi:hypothetical protein
MTLHDEILPIHGLWPFSAGGERVLPPQHETLETSRRHTMAHHRGLQLDLQNK